MTTLVALTIAGPDASGGAGIQADLKTMLALGVYGASAITALTAQNTRGVTGIHAVPAAFVTAQIDAVFSDLAVGAVKIGMVAQPDSIDAIAAGLAPRSPRPVVPDPVMEIRLWREATTVFMMSGPGGCEPFGLAVSGYESGLAAEIYVSFYGALFLQSVRSEDKRRVMELAQVDFRRRAELYGIPVNYRPFALDDIRGALAGGKLVLVLISGFLMFGKKVPHWVLAIGDDGDHILIHDPWVEDERQETILDAANIPVPYGIFMNMAQFGRDGLRAAITLGKRDTQ